MSHESSRRGFLKTAAGIASAAALGTRGVGAAPGMAGGATAGRRRVLRFAHPTDIHVQPELRGAEGMAAAFAHMMNLPERPEMIISGGDLPMDTASSDQVRSGALWKLFKTIWGERVPASIPTYHTIGNHDIFGRDKEKSKTTGKEAEYGKKWFCDNFGYEKTYRSFDRAGWHFVILDSFDMDVEGKDYTARIVGAQLEWLKADLAKTPVTTPIVVVSHVPIISVANFFDQDPMYEPDIGISRMRMHTDHRELDALFLKYPNVKVCLSGHLHLLDRVEYNGLTHICDGAVCGSKWKGPRRQTAEGYGVIDLFGDGSFEHHYMTYGWHAEKA